MIYVLAVIAGVVGAVGGWAVTAAVAVWVAGLFGMSDFEGGRGMVAAFVVGPVGGLIGMILLAWLVLRRAKGPMPFGATLARLTGVLAAIAALVAVGIALRMYSLDTYTNVSAPQLEFEIRIPAALPAPDPSTLRVEVDTDKNVGDAQLAAHWVPAEGDHQVISGSVPLAFKTASRLLVVKVPGQPTRLFMLSLSRDPRSTATLGNWDRPNHIYVEGEEQPRAAPADDPVEMRYRVRRAGED